MQKNSMNEPVRKFRQISVFTRRTCLLWFCNNTTDEMMTIKFTNVSYSDEHTERGYKHICKR